jgi:uncharacterized protein
MLRAAHIWHASSGVCFTERGGLVAGTDLGMGPRSDGRSYHRHGVGVMMSTILMSPRPDTATARPPVRRLVARSLAVAVGLSAVGVGVVVGRDGTPIWQVIRVAATVVVASVAMYLIRRGVVGPTAFITGIVSTAAGAGVAIPHLGKVGVSPVAVAGALALLAGIYLLVLGAAGIIGSAGRWWRRLLVAVVCLSVAYVSLWSGVQAVAVNNVPRTAVRSTSPVDRGLVSTEVEFMTADGVRLSGWYIPSTIGAAVVLSHGAGSTRSDVLDHAVVLARHGYGVLLFDARGHGRSGGRAMDFGWYGDLDTSAAVSFLAGRPEVDAQRIAAVGMSMGGEEAIGAAASDPRIRAVVAEGATNRVAADKAYLSELYGLRGQVQQRIDWFTYAVTDLLTDAGPPISLRAAAVAAAPHPVLLIAGGSVPDEGPAARHIQRGNPAVQVWEVPDTGHTRALYTHPDEWEQRVIGFLHAALGQPAAS